MSVGSGLHAKNIVCLLSRIVDGVRWFEVFARDQLINVTREIRPRCLILFPDHKNQTGSHWFALYAPLSGGIELFD